jgi:hypothetical protein
MKLIIGKFAVPGIIAPAALWSFLSASRRGRTLLQILKVQEPEPSDHLVHKILTRTSAVNRLEAVSDRCKTGDDS